ncbi:MAG: AMP-binding protein [Gammaproteobacteria bacterium]|jgi:long-chain acyl-CoA synthetase
MEPIWRKSYPAHVPTTVDPDSVGNLVNLMETAFHRYQDAPAYHNRGTTLTYSDVNELSDSYAAFLQTQLHLEKGDRIALMCPNILPFPVAMYGHLRAGLIQVNVNPLYTPRELKHQLNDAQAETVVLVETALPTLQAILGEVPVRSIIIIGAGDLREKEGPATLPDLPGVRSCRFIDAIRLGKQNSRSPVDLDGDDLAFLQYTGGTTGLAKGAMLSHRNVITNVLAFTAFLGDPIFGEEAEKIVITATPLYHILGLVVNCLSFLHKGGLNILIDNPRDMSGFVEELGRWPFTVITGVNTLFNALLHTPGFEELDFSSLKLAVGGGTPIQEAISNHWHSVTGKHVKEGYGMSETGGVTQTPPDMQGFRSTIGLPFPSLEVSLCDEEGNEVAMGEPGEICFRGPTVMRGYWGREDLNDQIFTADGFFRTGDIGTVDEDGYFHVVDRKKDMILVSGFNVYPIEVEEVGTAAPGVYECACIGVPDEKTGEAVKLFVVPKPGAEASVEAIRAYCRQNLAAYKVPKYVEFIDALPKSAVGKILRRELRK